MQFIRYWLFYALRAFVRVTLPLFFRKISVVGKPEETGPLMITATHTNGIMDVLLLGLYFERRIGILAEAELMSIRIPGYPRLSSILSTIPKMLFWMTGMVPIYRPQQFGTRNAAVANEETFASVYDALDRSEAILIFPTRANETHREVGEFASGFARMVLGAEARRNFQLGVRVQPVVITYGERTKFRSSVTISFVKPIDVSWYRELYERDEVGGIRSLKTKLESQIRSQAVSVPDPSYAELVERVAYLLMLQVPDDFVRLSAVVKGVIATTTQYPEEVERLAPQISRYLEQADALGITPGDEVEYRKVSAWLWWVSSPFIALGLLLHYLPYRAVGRIARLVARDIYYAQTGKFVVGALLVFPLWYLGLIFIYALIFRSVTGVMLAVALSVIVGVVANRWGARWVMYVRGLFPTKRFRNFQREGEVIRAELFDLQDRLQAA